MNDELKNYELKIDNKKKKSMGIYYTDENVANYIINQFNLKSSETVIDPNCGNGIFFHQLKKRYKEKLNINNIYGIDYDKKIIGILKDELYKNNPQNIVDNNFVYGNTLGISCKLLKKKYNYIIGNPPYVAGKAGKNYNPKYNNFKNYICGSVNLSMLVLIKAIQMIEKDGIISFVLTKNILHVESY